ncbi:U5 snRNP-associated RNA splicing factor, putative [Ixodes scapularis]|uniref:Pre-mRNA-splicing factor 18 n=2 Tax=Ixodes TaxID=6944 RepID=B7P571_IXOSC|nr:U5 snRNP-associated RNA splicing factor, putative [Ixodes scapularis]|eukprot:XP_002407104.1 U5 snRNP-associated RNA splicing factor, putative [Ixodes scapularis]
MDVLKAEIERKRRQLESKDLIGPNKKYFKREELIKKTEEEYLERRRAKGTDEGDDQASTSLSVASLLKRKQEDERVLPRKEVVRRLRERGEPVLLFAETETEAFHRLRRLEILEPEVDRGLRNDFQEAMEKVDQIYLDEILKSQGKTEDGKSIHDVKVDSEGTTIDDIQNIANELGERRNKGKDAEMILTALKFILQLWGEKLNSRAEAEKTSMRGKMSSATYNQTQAYLRPLFKRLRKNTIPEDILDHLVRIVKHMLQREYVRANDAYLQMAIGNAPWPIGVTMVGIHARTGREKIFSQNIAHVLNDETQRKFIQALKRLMTQCQRLFPTDPSRSVEYNA